MKLNIFNNYHLVTTTILYLINDSFAKNISTSLTELDQINERHSDLFIGPYLDGNEVINVTVQIGSTAYLPCKVKQLGNKSVSWVRIRDDHILTVDRSTFIADERFQSFFKELAKEWLLQIKYVQDRDAGIYECQVSTEPKVSAKVNLYVVVPRTELVGDSDRYVKAGSTVVLRCIIKGALEPPHYISWYHGTKQIFTENRPGITMKMNKEALYGESNTLSTIGTLIIETTRKTDSGNYTCGPSNSPPATITLHVINSESSASAVTSSACHRNIINSMLSLALLLVIIST